MKKSPLSRQRVSGPVTLAWMAAGLMAGLACGARHDIGSVPAAPPAGANGGGGAGGGGGPRPDPGPMCMPQTMAEMTCSGGTDEDCDGFIDCLDTECDGQ